MVMISIFLCESTTLLSMESRGVNGEEILIITMVMGFGKLAVSGRQLAVKLLTANYLLLTISTYC